MTTRRRRNDPPKIELTREPFGRIVGIAGRDEYGEGWMGLDATKSKITCKRCSDRIQYGYAPLRNTTKRAHCVNCVVFVDAERSGR